MKEQIKEHAKVVGKIVLKSMGKWALIVFLGCTVSVISFLISFLFNIDLLFVDNLSFSGYMSELFHENIPALIVIFGTPFFIFFYIVMAQKVSIQNSIYLLFQSELGDQIISALIGAVDKITQKKGWHSDVLDQAMLKAKVLQAVKDNPETSGFQRSILQYGFRKVRLDDVDFQDENMNLSILLSAKFRQFFAGITKPSLLFFWILILFQFILSITSIFL